MQSLTRYFHLEPAFFAEPKRKRPGLSRAIA